MTILTALFNKMFIFPSKDHFFKYFYKKVLARDLKIPIMHRTQRRTVVKFFKFPSASLFFAL
ncbi:Trk system potassium uptake protein TrkH [Haemophilus influenzae CGSHiCZ412602]|nr:Trk system potassium uptake protein TrkH [Haemophilus influenzae CGSHiCZ412602]